MVNTLLPILLLLHTGKPFWTGTKQKTKLKEEKEELMTSMKT